MYVLQDCFIAFFGFTYKYTSRLSQTVRNLICFACLLWLTGSFYFLMVLNHSVGTEFTVRKLTFWGNILMVIFAIMSVRGELHRVKWNKWIVYPYIIGAIYMLFTSFHHYPGRSYDTFPIQLLFIFPAIYFVWGNRKHCRIYYEWLAKASMGIGAVMIIATLIFAPLGEDTVISNQYCGLTDNPNVLAMLLMMSLAGTLYLIRPGNNKSLIYAVLAGISMGMMLLSNSRGGIIVGALQLAAWAVITVRIYWSRYGVKTVATVLAVLVITAACVPLTNLMIDRGSESPASDPAAETSQSVEEIEENTANRFSTEGKDLNAFTSGRIDIWKWHISKFNLLGHDCTDHEIVIYEGAKPLHNAHNTYIELAYRYGVPAGVAYGLFMVALIVFLIRAALVRGRNPYVMIVVLFSIAYFIESLVDVMTLPFERGPVIMFYLALVGVFEDDILNSGEEKAKDDSNRKSGLHHNGNELGENIPEHSRRNRVRRKSLF